MPTQEVKVVFWGAHLTFDPCSHVPMLDKVSIIAKLSKCRALEIAVLLSNLDFGADLSLLYWHYRNIIRNSADSFNLHLKASTAAYITGDSPVYLMDPFFQHRRDTRQSNPDRKS
jgi:hypothetical protein